MSSIIIPRLPECYTVFVSGPVSSGKSYLLKRWVEMKERVLICDMAADYISSSDYEHFISIPELCQRLKSNPHYFRLAYHVNRDRKNEDFFYQYAAIWQLQKPRWFFIEECHEVCGVNFMADGMENLCRYSRHNLLGVVAASQRIADVHTLLRSNARMVVLFHTTEARDLLAIRERWGAEVENAVRNLRPCIYADDTQTLLQAPECVVYLKGHGYRVVSLGDKVLPQQTIQKENEEQWHEIFEEVPSTPEPQSSPQDSGIPAPLSAEDTSEVM